jgi:hypothetical protein
MLFIEIIPIYSEYHTKLTILLYGPNLELFIKASGIYCYQWTSKG